jgi:hypothetical protein
MQAKFDKEKGGAAFHLTGMQRVAEGKIEHLNSSQLKNLVRKGVLSRVYAHLLSMDNFARLLDRKAARAGGGATCGNSDHEVWGCRSGNGLRSAVTLGRLAGENAAASLT